MGISSLGQIIKRAVLSLIGRDLDNYSVSQVTYNGKTGDCELIWPYGFCANPPKNSIVLMFNVMGQEENRAGFANLPQMRFKGLKEGEVVVGNYLTKSFVKFTQEGNVEIFSSLDTNLEVVKTLNVVVGAGINIVCGADCTIDGSGFTLNVLGDVHLGGDGGAAIARVGDAVQCPTGIGHIIEGSSNHTAN